VVRARRGMGVWRLAGWGVRRWVRCRAAEGVSCGGGRRHRLLGRACMRKAKAKGLQEASWWVGRGLGCATAHPDLMWVRPLHVAFEFLSSVKPKL
jgi:hypothetical protein